MPIRRRPAITDLSRLDQAALSVISSKFSELLPASALYIHAGLEFQPRLLWSYIGWLVALVGFSRCVKFLFLFFSGRNAKNEKPRENPNRVGRAELLSSNERKTKLYSKFRLREREYIVWERRGEILRSVVSGSLRKCSEIRRALITFSNFMPCRANSDFTERVHLKFRCKLWELWGSIYTRSRLFWELFSIKQSHAVFGRFVEQYTYDILLSTFSLSSLANLLVYRFYSENEREGDKKLNYFRNCLYSAAKDMCGRAAI